MKQIFEVTDSLHGQTIKQYLTDRGVSTTETKRLKFGGTITADGIAVTVRHVMQKGQTIVLQTQCATTPPIPSQTKAQIIFEDEYLFVAYKPHGLPTHPDRTHKTDTLGNRISATFGGTMPLHVITRLDKVTSGLVLCAKEEHLAQLLNTVQQGGGITKTYYALVEGFVAQNGSIVAPLLRVDSQNKTVVSSDGKPAKTSWRIVEYKQNATLLAVTPITGRTHQIRAHLAHIGNPIVGDVLYGAAPSQRVALQCAKLSFVHPSTLARVEVEIPCEF